MATGVARLCLGFCMFALVRRAAYNHQVTRRARRSHAARSPRFNVAAPPSRNRALAFLSRGFRVDSPRYLG
jgi:hypothetical protein